MRIRWSALVGPSATIYFSQRQRAPWPFGPPTLWGLWGAVVTPLLGWGCMKSSELGLECTTQCTTSICASEVKTVWQWCSQGQNLKTKASTLKAKAKAWTFEAKAKAWTFEAKAIGPSAKAFNHIRPHSRSGHTQYIWQPVRIGNELNSDCFCLDIHSFIHSNL